MWRGYDGLMRGGIERWKRGVRGLGIRAAADYAFEGACDATTTPHAAGVDKAAEYADDRVMRFTASARDGVSVDGLDREQLRHWIDGMDPTSGEQRGYHVKGANADLIFDATVNTPKSLSIAAMLDPELRAGMEALHDRIRDRALTLWLEHVNARRGAGGQIRMGLSQVEMVELHHERSRALDPHAHRHLWLNAKVLGDDGRWSNLDSRVLLRFQSILNAEGDLATTSDPQWRALLAAKGLHVDASTGEIAELAHLTAPLSRRARQIDAARDVRLRQWHEDNPGLTPTTEQLREIDRRAWADGRPKKPKNLSEDDWRATVLEELGQLDPDVAQLFNGPREADRLPAPQIAGLDRDHLALMALASADQRATSKSGRFSAWDVQAAATRVVAQTGVIADRQVLSELIDDVAARAVADHALEVLDDVTPGHVRNLMARETVALKAELHGQLNRLARRHMPLPVDAASVRSVASETSEHELDRGQEAAAAAVAGRAGLVTVVGPAGTGKTTMLKVARVLLEAQGRDLLMVAPTRKAAAVVGRETGSPATSVHSFLMQFGWRWGDDETGRTRWWRLSPGDVDASTGEVWEPPQLTIGPNTKVVVDEAGMTDLFAARALAAVAEETGCELAFVGDPLQVLPVGHSGAMSMAERAVRSAAGPDRESPAAVELESIHRFRNADGSPDRGWAELSRDLREPGTRRSVDELVSELLGRDRVRVLETPEAATNYLVGQWHAAHAARQSTVVVVPTNEEGRIINQAIQISRISAGQLKVDKTAQGIDGQMLLVGDTVQTRRNRHDLGVQNRGMWEVSRITADAVTLRSTGTDHIEQTVPREFAAEHVQLAYATTAHGVQGETVDRAFVAPGVAGAGLYVGLTRGKRHNEALAIGASEDAAREALTEQLGAATFELDMDDARAATLRELRAAATGTYSLPSWRNREYGSIVRLGAAIEEARRRVPHAEETVQESQDRVDLLEFEILKAKREHTTATAAQRTPDPAIGNVAELRTELLEAQEQLRTLQRDNRRPVEVLTGLEAEANIRRLVLSEEELRREDAERSGALPVASPSQTPAGVSAPAAWQPPAPDTDRGPDLDGPR